MGAVVGATRRSFSSVRRLLTPKWGVVPPVGRPRWQSRHHEGTTGGLVASANPRTRGRHRRVRCGGSRNSLDGDRGRRNPERAGAADAHPKFPAYAYREHANTDHGRANIDHGRVNIDYGRVNIAVESIRPGFHGANRHGSSATARVGNRKWPAADLAGRP